MTSMLLRLWAISETNHDVQKDAIMQFLHLLHQPALQILRALDDHCNFDDSTSKTNSSTHALVLSWFHGNAHQHRHLIDGLVAAVYSLHIVRLLKA